MNLMGIFGKMPIKLSLKGFVIDDVRLASGGTVTGTSDFDEMLERVRSIRGSEKNFYQKIKDIFATSVDYDSKTDYAKQFYATVQNKSFL